MEWSGAVEGGGLDGLKEIERDVNDLDYDRVRLILLRLWSKRRCAGRGDEEKERERGRQERQSKGVQEEREIEEKKHSQQISHKANERIFSLNDMSEGCEYFPARVIHPSFCECVLGSWCRKTANCHSDY